MHCSLSLGGDYQPWQVIGDSVLVSPGCTQFSHAIFWVYSCYISQQSLCNEAVLNWSIKAILSPYLVVVKATIPTFLTIITSFSWIYIYIYIWKVAVWFLALQFIFVQIGHYIFIKSNLNIIQLQIIFYCILTKYIPHLTTVMLYIFSEVFFFFFLNLKGQGNILTIYSLYT